MDNFWKLVNLGMNAMELLLGIFTDDRRLSEDRKMGIFQPWLVAPTTAYLTELMT
jgi:hypothetical protein